MRPRCDNCGLAALVPHHAPQLQGAVSIGRVTLCFECVRDAVGLAARINARLLKPAMPQRPDDDKV